MKSKARYALLHGSPRTNERKPVSFLRTLLHVATPIHVVGTFTGVVREAQQRQGAALLAVLNVTPDSFYDGGAYQHIDHMVRRIDELIAEGADIIDVGPESTRPGAARVPGSVQMDRAAPAIARAVERGALVSIDTTLPEVAEAALKGGARIINDVSCLADVTLARLAAQYDADLIIMHSRGSMVDMAGFSVYDAQAYQDIVVEVSQEWSAARAPAMDQGLARERNWLEPGLGVHKNAPHSVELLRRLGEFSQLGAQLVVGPSRKSFLGALDGSPPERRLGGTIAACLAALQAGASVLRVHDVFDVRQALLAHQSLRAASPSPTIQHAARAAQRGQQ
jgi:dihydropteroate synthase